MRPNRAAKRARTESTKKEMEIGYSFEKRGFPSSTAQGRHAFKWLLSGIGVRDFFAQYFEKKPAILHNDEKKFRELISVDKVREFVISGKKLRKGTDLDVTKYSVSEGRTTLNDPAGSYTSKATWDQVTEGGCSLRLLRPQEHFDAIWHLCAWLEGFLGCVIGANAYLTPCASQGFAPHFDDIDAFVCQVSGQKRWRVYGPRDDGLDVLPRASSVDFTEEEMRDVEVLFDQVLQPGDMLYLPRGTIHQAECPERTGSHDVEEASLHVTISAFQKWTWADLLLESFQVAVQSAAAQDKSLRRTLPQGFGEFIGVSRSEGDEKLREWFETTMRQMVRRVGKHYPTDTAGDMMMTRFMRERLPPVGKSKKRKREAGSASLVRAVGAGVARVVMDCTVGGDELPHLIHCVGNTRRADLGSGEGLSCLPEEAFAISFVLDKYPEAVRVSELPLGDVDDQVDLVRGLVDMGIVEVLQ
ncbi:unnamed protein product [Chondrus crispus]|uniref:Bifunctional lysine-specific demethylase and histidyl-hydroxylase n=1 Tax=Chondrus crispus TaxID=2769 RepID=R7QE26_CHOCR|nr:unnamed protein product [Chondrus crispus]CDF35685.1 unnamed protein product [Chondrus crispus]|eukprot:XP_005715504.1 unnamed protein product [Chondrus crispus]